VILSYWSLNVRVSDRSAGGGEEGTAHIGTPKRLSTLNSSTNRRPSVSSNDRNVNAR
jgi:hypothetical protein